MTFFGFPIKDISWLRMLPCIYSSYIFIWQWNIAWNEM